jgi:hypothetical protein
MRSSVIHFSYELSLNDTTWPRPNEVLRHIYTINWHKHTMSSMQWYVKPNMAWQDFASWNIPFVYSLKHAFDLSSRFIRKRQYCTFRVYISYGFKPNLHYFTCFAGWLKLTQQSYMHTIRSFVQETEQRHFNYNFFL